MNMRSRREKDLLGRPIRKRKLGFHALLERHDRATLPGRVDRLTYLKSIHPGGTFMFSTEMFYLLDEVKATFVNAEYTGTILLASAFIEQWLSCVLGSKGLHKEARSGLKGIIDCMREHKIGQEFVLAKIDKLRLIRIPFGHSKDFNYEHGLGRRSVDMHTHPDMILEKDAKNAISLVYAVASARY